MTLKNWFEKVAQTEPRMHDALQEAIDAWRQIVFALRDQVKETITTYVQSIIQLDSVYMEVRAALIEAFEQW
jgi:hypothetical protein